MYRRDLGNFLGLELRVFVNLSSNIYINFVKNIMANSSSYLYIIYSK